MKKTCNIVGVLLIFILLIVVFRCGNNKKMNMEIKYDKQKNIFFSEELSKRILLANILNYDNKILITEDNIDNTSEIIEEIKLKNGIYVSKNSRNDISNILKVLYGNNFYIDENGYIQKKQNVEKLDSSQEKIIQDIEADKCLIIHIDNTYKGILDNGAILDFMVENIMYVQDFNYNDYVRIVLINSEKLNVIPEELTEKEVYEEIVLNIFR